MSIQPLTRLTAQTTLEAMIKDAGISANMLDLEKTWDVFIKFCEIPIETTTDGVIVQWGRIDEWETPYKYKQVGFYFSVLRQFDDEDEEFEQLTIQWSYPIIDHLKAINDLSSDWCFVEQGCNFTDFLSLQRESELFQYLKTQKPYLTEVFQENTG